jgi:succinate-semialdehyde dehydrogenase/glutarate-semialdehyde dehydrogenase
MLSEAGFITTINPATGEKIFDHPTLGDAELLDLLAQADDAYQAWRLTSIDHRIGLFRAMASALDNCAEDFARVSSIEMGRPYPQSLGEANQVSTIFRYYADNAKKLLAPRPLNVPGFRHAETVPEAVGVVLAIEPWNSPLFQAMRAAAPNIMLGNTVILKPSSITPGSTLLFDRVFAEVGFPEHVYTTALFSASSAPTLIEDPRVRAITLTGSNAAGASVGEQAGRAGKPVVLELGGSDPFVVLDSADVDAAASTASMCRLLIGGQTCISPKRVILADSIADSFIEKYSAAFASQVVGDPFDEKTTVGPLASAEAADDLQELYQDAIDKGATVLVAGGRVAGPGAYFTPAVLTDITPDMRLYTEEAFGPIGMIYRVANADAAVELANDTIYGLGASVFGSEEEARAVAARIDSGSVAINSWLGGPVEVPFGGTKASGTGRELGPSGIEQFANVKTYAFA